MDWLVALLVLLGLGALAGLAWLHFGRAPGARSGNPARGESGDPESAELSIAVGYLRRRASHYREMAVKLDDAVSGARSWDLAGLFDRAADALENEPDEGRAGRGG